MAPFQYQTFESPYANTIAQLLAHQGDPQAQAAQTIAAANARAGEQAAQAWGGAVQGITGAFKDTVGTIQREQEIAPKLAAEKIALDNLQQKQRGEAALNVALAGNTLSPDEAGPRLPTFTTPDHRYDIPALRDWLASRGYGAQMDDLLGHAEKMNTQLDDADAAKQAAQVKNAIYTGTTAQGALKLAEQINIPYTGAVKFMSQQGLGAGQFAQGQVDTVLQHLDSLPPDQQKAYLQSLVDKADRLQKPIVYKEGEVGVGATSGNPLYTAPEKKDETWLQNDAATLGKPNQTKTAAQSMEAVRLKNPEWWLKNDAATVGLPNETPTAKQSAIAVGIGHARTAEEDDERYRGIRVAQRLNPSLVTPENAAWADAYKEQKTLGPDLTAKAALERLDLTIKNQNNEQLLRQMYQRQEDGRHLLDKVEAEYTTRAAAANMLERTIKEAQGDPARGIKPNMSAAALQNLEETMAMIRAQNLNRINTAEIAQNAGAGSLVTNVESWIGKKLVGQEVPKEIQEGMLRMAKILREEAATTYAQKFSSAKQRYLLGDDVQPFIKIPKYDQASGTYK